MSSDGIPFFRNRVTRESTWHRPIELAQPGYAQSHTRKHASPSRMHMYAVTQNIFTATHPRHPLTRTHAHAYPRTHTLFGAAVTHMHARTCRHRCKHCNKVFVEGYQLVHHVALKHPDNGQGPPSNAQEQQQMLLDQAQAQQHAVPPPSIDGDSTNDQCRIRCEVCQVTLQDATAYAAHLNTRKHKKRSSDPIDIEPAVMNKIIGGLKTCLKFLTPPNWSMSPAEIERMEPTSLSHFPLDQFLAHYSAQMEEFIASRVAQATDSIATSEHQLAKSKAGTQELRQQLDELHDIKEMAEAGALSRDELKTVITLAGGMAMPT